MIPLSDLLNAKNTTELAGSRTAAPALASQ
jgi:hypothetical protein